MRFAARAFISSIIFVLFVAFLVPQAVFAQSHEYIQGQPPASSQYVPSSSHIDPTLPANQHVRVQALVIDILAAVVCQLSGIDPVDPSKPCVTIDPLTKKLGYSQTQYDENGQPKIGGLLGASTHLIGVMYTPTISSRDYGQYLAQNFGVTKPAYAAPQVVPNPNETGYGFAGLNPLLTLWTAVRNAAYFMLMVAFVLIGLGIMLRVKVDPRTVMTLQNQIPRIIIAILLVTFSYGIAGVLIDSMWLLTFVGINVITTAGNTNELPGVVNPYSTNLLFGSDQPLSRVATDNLLQTPLGFVNEIFKNMANNWGIGNLTTEISFGLGAFLEEIVRGFFGLTVNDACVGWSGVNLGACLASVFGFIASLLLWLIILITILKLLFSVWFTLLKAYTYVIFYTIGAPIFIVLGLLPGKPYGFEKWLRSMVANLAVFPLTAFLFMIARLFMQLFQGSTPDQFIPPLVFQPNLGVWGVMLAFGVFLMTPTLLAMLQEALKVTGTKYGSAIGAGLAAGAAAPRAGFGAMWSHATRKAKLHEHDAGWLRQRIAGQAAVKQDLVGKAGYPGPVVNWIRKQRNKLYKFDSSGHTPKYRK